MNSNLSIKTSLKMLAAACGALLITFALTPQASAQCGSLGKTLPTHIGWHPQFAQPRLLKAAYVLNADWDEHGRDQEPIVGFWHEKFIAGKTVIDAGYSQWHSDGTEILNSGGHAPDTSSFCLGVWEKVGERHYKLNHFAIAWDPIANVLAGTVQILEDVTVKSDGRSYDGTFRISQFDADNNYKTGVAGDITATRVDVDTPSERIF